MKWKESIKTPPGFATRSGRPNTPEFYEILKMGTPVVPFIIEKLEKNPEDYLLEVAVRRITKKGFDANKWPPGQKGGAITAAKLYVSWWREDRKHTREHFDQIYSEWKQYKAQKREKEIQLKLKSFKFLGIDALPFLIEKINGGDLDLMQIIEYLTNRKIKKTTTIPDLNAWWEKNKEKWTLPEPE